MRRADDHVIRAGYVGPHLDDVRDVPTGLLHEVHARVEGVPIDRVELRDFRRLEVGEVLRVRHGWLVRGVVDYEVAERIDVLGRRDLRRAVGLGHGEAEGVAVLVFPLDRVVVLDLEKLFQLVRCCMRWCWRSRCRRRRGG